MWTTLSECQFLCAITDLCLYFNWRQTSYWESEESVPERLGTCWLKYGVGATSLDSTNNTFGHKNTAGGQNVTSY